MFLMNEGVAIMRDLQSSTGVVAISFVALLSVGKAMLMHPLADTEVHTLTPMGVEDNEEREVAMVREGLLEESKRWLNKRMTPKDYSRQRQHTIASLGRINSTVELRRLFVWCQENIDLLPREHDEEVLSTTQYVITDRLVELRHVGGTETLVGLLKDESVHLDGELALDVMMDISECGKSALKPLLQINGSRKVLAEELIEVIRQGRTYGP
jgi:hypothetical protein